MACALPDSGAGNPIDSRWFLPESKRGALMRLLPMDEPAEIHRRTGGGKARDITVARGPLLAMARGLMEIDPLERGDFWITSARGNLTAAEAEESLRRWVVKH